MALGQNANNYEEIKRFNVKYSNAKIVSSLLARKFTSFRPDVIGDNQNKGTRKKKTNVDSESRIMNSLLNTFYRLSQFSEVCNDTFLSGF